MEILSCCEEETEEGGQGSLPSCVSQPDGHRNQGIIDGLPAEVTTRETLMATEPSENGEGTEVLRTTDYSAQSGSGAKPGFALSAWSLVIGGGFILLFVAGLLLF